MVVRIQWLLCGRCVLGGKVVGVMDNFEKCPVVVRKNEVVRGVCRYSAQN